MKSSSTAISELSIILGVITGDLVEIGRTIFLIEVCRVGYNISGRFNVLVGRTIAVGLGGRLYLFILDFLSSFLNGYGFLVLFLFPRGATFILSVVACSWLDSSARESLIFVSSVEDETFPDSVLDSLEFDTVTSVRGFSELPSSTCSEEYSFSYEYELSRDGSKTSECIDGLGVSEYLIVGDPNLKLDENSTPEEVNQPEEIGVGKTIFEFESAGALTEAGLSALGLSGLDCTSLGGGNSCDDG